MTAVGSAANTKRGRRRSSRYHHGDLRAALIRATIEWVEREGLDGLTLNRLAGHLQVSPPALYHHFASKTDLIAAACAEAFEKLDAALAEAEIACEEAAPARLRALAIAYLTFAVERRGEFQLTYGSHVASLELSGYEAVAGPGRRAKQRMRSAVAAAFDDQLGSISNEQRFAILWAQLVGLASLLSERELGPEVSLPELLTLAEHALSSHLTGLRTS